MSRRSRRYQHLNQKYVDQCLNRYRTAMRCGDVSVISQMAVTRPVRRHLTNNPSEAFGWYGSSNPAIRFELLQMPAVFKFAKQDLGRDDYLKIFADQFLRWLRDLCTGSLSVDQGSPYDFNGEWKDDQAELGYLLLEYIIETDFSSADWKIELLLKIPAVYSAVVDETNERPYSNNWLVRLALKNKNRQALHSLFKTRTLLEAADRENYYSLIPDSEVNLKKITQNKESSMRELSSDQTLSWNNVVEFYTARINAQGGMDVVFVHLQEFLLAEYAKEPAKFMVPDSEQVVELPVQWGELNKLAAFNNWSPIVFNQILIEYYKNIWHTAWRYLTNDTKWRSPHAKYAFNAEQTATVCITWYAAKDPAETEEAAAGYTPENRVRLFVDELAKIGRAHNWDRTRKRKLYRADKSSYQIEEEYDDLEGDQPSCPYGVKRRLYHSIHGHSLFRCLKDNLLEGELREFLYEYFKRDLNFIRTHRPSIYTTLYNAFNLELGSWFVDHDTQSTGLLAFLKVRNSELKLFQMQLRAKLFLKHGVMSLVEVNNYMRNALNTESFHGSLYLKFCSRFNLGHLWIPLVPPVEVQAQTANVAAKRVRLLL